MADIDIKYNQILGFIRRLGKVTVAFSGGTDSALLAKLCKDSLRDKVMTVTVISPYIAKWEIEEACGFAAELNIKHKFLGIDIPEDIKHNPPNRCYLCKRHIFIKIKEFSEKEGFHYILDGTNHDDLSDYRPGIKALRELNVISPFAACGITKPEIRELSKKLGLTTWNKPAYACLMTRLPHGIEVRTKTLEMIESAEKYLIDLGIRAVRVRVHGDAARIEVDPEQRERFFNCSFLDMVSTALKDIGFKYVALDMAGYRMGSFNKIEKVRVYGYE